MQVQALALFLESLLAAEPRGGFSDAGIIRLLTIYEANDLQPPVTLTIEADWRGITLPPRQDQP